MNIAEWLSSALARDIMVRELVTLSPDQSLAEAADVLYSKQISGAPVVNDSGRCVGICTGSDILHAEHKASQERAELANSEFWTSGLALPASIYAEKLGEIRDKLVPAADQIVRNFMTTDLVTVSEDDSVGSIVRKMIDVHIHRVIVTSSELRLVGIISMVDVLAALMRSSQLATTR